MVDHTGEQAERAESEQRGRSQSREGGVRAEREESVRWGKSWREEKKNIYIFKFFNL